MRRTISSPPPSYNFAQVPQVLGQDHYWIVKRQAEATGNPITKPEPFVDPETIHMPNPSYWPIFTAFGLLLLAVGFLIEFPWQYLKFPIAIPAGIIIFIGVMGWSFEPAAPEGHHGDDHSDGGHH